MRRLHGRLAWSAILKKRLTAQPMYQGRLVSIGAGAYGHPLDKLVLPDTKCFGIWINIVFGVEGQGFTLSTGAAVCSPRWLQAALDDLSVIRGGEFIILNNFDPLLLANSIARYAESCRSTTIKGVFNKLERFGYPETQDFNDRPALRQLLSSRHPDDLIGLQVADADGIVIN
jgi:hypothetical protein